MANSYYLAGLPDVPPKISQKAPFATKWVKNGFWKVVKSQK